MTPDFKETFTGSGRYPRAIRELQHSVRGQALRAGPDVLVDASARGVTLRLKPGARSRAGGAAASAVPRWG